MILPPQSPPIIREPPPRYEYVAGRLVPIVRTDRNFRECVSADEREIRLAMQGLQK